MTALAYSIIAESRQTSGGINDWSCLAYCSIIQDSANKSAQRQINRRSRSKTCPGYLQSLVNSQDMKMEPGIEPGSSHILACADHYTIPPTQARYLTLYSAPTTRRSRLIGRGPPNLPATTFTFQCHDRRQMTRKQPEYTESKRGLESQLSSQTYPVPLKMKPGIESRV